MDANFSTSKADIQRIERQLLTSQETRWHDFPWSNLFGAATLLGLVIYGSVGFGFSIFYDFLGVEMREVGIGYTTVLSSFGVNLSIIIPLFMTFSIFLIFFGDRAKDHRAKAYTYYGITLIFSGLAAMLGAAFLLHSGDLVYILGTISWTLAGVLFLRAATGPSPLLSFVSLVREGWREREPWPTSRREAVRRIAYIIVGLAMIAGVLLYTIVEVRGNPGQYRAAMILIPLVVALSLIPRKALRSLFSEVLPLPRLVLVSTLGLLISTIVLTGAWWGYVLAEDVRNFDLPPEETLAPLIMDVQMLPVCAAWTGANSPPNSISTSHQLVS
jgi:hypothetical protein